ncbi:hypothetical protein [Alphaentomopoxvirus acuprea]|uniref:Uncharacterized protein n=1 Tax=Alphaentomopoxvirus acuprea TaxID=62099 RepID=W6JPN2_9POXV|nr:hypothetical protein BA82_gp214 [Anomala cuprea entomopoxvirus]BAO49574.1 hypothetical protein [Anomala cuprea entomopoxvirus]
MSDIKEYERVLNKLYNNHIKYINIKQINDLLTSEIFKYMDTNIITDLYSIVIDNLLFGNVYLKGGLVVQHLLNDILSGDIDISIELKQDKYEELKFKLDNKKFISNFIILNPNIINVLTDVILNNYYYRLEDICNNITLSNIIPLDILKDNQVVFFPYENRIAIIENMNYIKLYLIPEIFYSISILPAFILIRFYMKIKLNTDPLIYDIIYDNINIPFNFKFYFLDISVVKVSIYKSLEQIIINDTIINTQSVLDVISNQLSTLLDSKITNTKYAKRLYRMSKFLIVYKNELVTNIQLPTNIKDKLLYSFIKERIISIKPLQNYYEIKYLIENNKIIYLLNQLIYTIVIDTDLISTNFNDYVQQQLLDLIKYMDKIINNLNDISGSISQLTNEEYNHQLIESFGFSKSDFDDYDNNRNFRSFINSLL